ncbi:DUF29 family protein [Spirulina sp. CS-785/01]|uniref:DUF29 family protein n=1 Tax=Spirulina sp. CS-785/01 TaxID=3021716 RepID=UPI00232B9763|nr:DUF29 family protein [Spirulina sp. CS-785/01]MDB9315928.1 DUF29 family protein [Spirulina sp. CS-785/01]
MVQELIDLRQNIIEGRYEEALELVDELEWMSKKAVIRTIQSFLVRLLIHLIKNQVEQRLTNSWASSIRDSVLQIQDLNLKDNKKSYYIKPEDWDEYLENALDSALFKASEEVLQGQYSPFQLEKEIDPVNLIKKTQLYLEMTYIYSPKELRQEMNQHLIQLVGGKNWQNGNQT